MSMISQVLSEAYAGLKGLVKYKETLFWVIVFPLLWYGLAVTIWGSPSSITLDVGVVDNDIQDDAWASKALIEALNSTGILRLEPYSNETALAEAVSQGDLPAGIVIPEGFTRSLESMQEANISLYYASSQAGMTAYTVVTGLLDSFNKNISRTALEQVEQSVPLPGVAVRFMSFLIEPVGVEENRVTPPILATREGVRAYHAISTIGVEALFIGMFFGALSLNEKKRTGALRLLLAAPITGMRMLAADTIAALAYTLIPTVVVLLVSLLLGAEYPLTPGQMLLAGGLLAAATVSAIGMGLILATLAKTPEGASALVNLVAFPVMFIGGIVVPREVLPAALQGLADVIPVSRLVEAVRMTVVYNNTAGEVLSYAAPAIAATIVLYAVGAAAYRKLIEKAVEHGA